MPFAGMATSHKTEENMKRFMLVFAVLLVLATACTSAPTPTPVPPTATALPPTSTPIPPTSTPLPTATATLVPPTATATLPPTATPLPGKVVVPLEKMDKNFPWLPLDKTAVPGTAVLTFNTKKPPFDNKLVRQAFAASIDRKAVSTLAATLQGTQSARTAVTFTPPETLGRDLSSAVAVYDPAKARDLLAKAGYPNGQGFPEITIVFPGVANDTLNQLFGAATKMWQDNLKVTVKVQPGGTNARQQTDAPIQFWLWWAESNDPDSFLARVYQSRSANNYGGFSNPDFDRLVEQARTSSDPATRQALYIQAERILLDDEAATIPYYYLTARRQ
jgi:ABC-type transport system substrate-binding protein